VPVLNIARQPYYRWLAQPVTDAALTEAYRADALVDAHREDPEFGYRFLADEARTAGQVMAYRTAWRRCCAGRYTAPSSNRPTGWCWPPCPGYSPAHGGRRSSLPPRPSFAGTGS
jgi:putative transposase